MIRSFYFSLPILLLFTAFGCHRAPERPPLPIPIVVVEEVQVRDVPSYIETTGTTDAYEFVEVVARVSGFLQEIRYAAGDIVAAGTPLFLIQPEQYQAEVKAAEGGLASAHAHLSLAEANLSRTQQLFDRATLTKEDLDTAIAQRDESAAAVIQAEARLQTAQLNLSYTDIRSPITGKVDPSIFSTGNMVGPSGNNMVLATVAGMDPIFVNFDISDSQFNTIRAFHLAQDIPVVREQPSVQAEGAEHSSMSRLEELQIAFKVGLIRGSEPGAQDFPYEGIIETAFNTINPTTGTIMVRGKVPNADYGIFPGQICRVRIPMWKIPDAVLVRQEAIGTDLTQRYVYVVDENNVAHRRVVELGALQDDGTRIVTQGLEKGERYVVSGIQRVRDGSQVNVRE